MLKVLPKLRPIVEKDSLARFYQLCYGWSHLMGIRGFIFPEILSSMVPKNAVRCARAALDGRAPLRGRRAGPNGRHSYGFSPLHLAAETFSVEMVKLLLRHGASANHRTEGDRVIEDLLPLHVAVENASMHKYLEDHWAYGCPLDNLISLLCLPEMKIYLDTTRLIAAHTDNIADEVWNYIEKKKLVQLAILLLVAQKQLRGPVNRSRGKVSLNGFDIVRHHTYDALGDLHHQMIAKVNEGKNGNALKKLEEKKEALLTAGALIGIVHKAGEALEEYIQTQPEVSHEEILKHVSSILDSKGIVPSGRKIDTAKLECYQYPGQTSIHKSDSRVDTEGTNGADTSYSLNAEFSKRAPGKKAPKGFAIRKVRNKFFPYWKSVLSARLQVHIVPPFESSETVIIRTEPSKKDDQCIQPTRKDLQPRNNSIGSVISMARARVGSNYESRRQLCGVASMFLKTLRHT